MNENPNAVVILAAGSSSRMGKPKQLLSWGEGTLLQSAINQAVASDFEKVIVVLGAKAEAIKKTIPSNVISVINKNWENGMGSSIACGMHLLMQQKEEFASVLIMLGDQPLIDTDYLNSMLSVFQKETRGIVATDYKGRAGVPALFDQCYFEELKKLNAEYGAKELLGKEGLDILLLNAGIKTADIDTEADYIKLNNINR